MGKLVHRHGNYIVIEDDHRKRGHIIINTEGKYSNHGHVKYLNSCKKLLRLMDRQVVPDNPYFRGTVLRISLNEKYKANVLNKIEKDASKTHYINVNRGCEEMKLSKKAQRLLDYLVDYSIENDDKNPTIGETCKGCKTTVITLLTKTYPELEKYLELELKKPQVGDENE